MFTGLVETTGLVDDCRRQGPAIRLVLDCGPLRGPADVGDSVAVAGCCLTVVAARRGAASMQLAFEAGPETIQRTTLGQLARGRRVNLESSLRAGDPLGGHFVTGHVDGLGRLVQRQDQHDWSTFWFSAPRPLLGQMASKGSIAIDGVSLTLVDVLTDRFSVALIPHTLQVTTLGSLQAGAEVNLETDLLAKYVERQLRPEDAREPPS